jgi:hypothetical protein
VWEGVREDPSIVRSDPEFLRCASALLYHVNGAEMQRWRDDVLRPLRAAQAREGAAAGSWIGTGTGDGASRVRTTALTALALEVDYGYPMPFEPR